MKISKRQFIYYTLLLFLFFTVFISYKNFSPKKDSLTQKKDILADNLVSEKVKIKYAQWSVSSTTVVESVLNNYNKNNGINIQIENLKIPADKYIETLNMLNSSGEGPDVYELLNEWMGSYISKGWLLDLSNYIDENFYKAYPKWIIDFGGDYADKSKLYTIPSNQITYRLIYNKDLFKKAGLDTEAPPKTLEELAQYAKAISIVGRGERKYGFALPMGEELIGFVQPMEATNSYSGIYYYDFKHGRYDLTVYLPWMKTFKELNDNGAIFPGMASMKNDLALLQFAEGNIGMMYASSRMFSLFYQQLTLKCEWAVAMPPALDEKSIGKGAISISPAGMNVINSKSKHKIEAVNVWKYLYSKECLGELYKNCSIIPTISEIFENPEYSKISALPKFRDFIPGNKDSVYPKTPINIEEWQRINTYIQAFSAENQTDKFLLDENYRINLLLDNEVAAGTININDFQRPKFDSINPMNP